MNIALLHYTAPPIVGGVESILRQHAQLMANAGHHVRVIAGRGAPFGERIEFVSIPQVDSRDPEVLAAKSELDAGKVPKDFPGLSSSIERELRQHLGDSAVLIAHNVCSLHKNLALTAALRRLWDSRGVPRLVLWHHDLAWTAPRYARELHAGYPWDLLRTDWPGATQVAVSLQRQRELAGLMGTPLDRIHVVPNGIDVRTFVGLGPRVGEIVAALGLLRAAPIILLPVRITTRKNIELAIRTLAVLRGTFPDARLLVTGPPGPHNAANQRYLQDLVDLRRDLGLEGAASFLSVEADADLSDEDVAELYRLADLVLLPSKEEGFGIPILEAGLVGAPVFCSDIETLHELGRSEAEYFEPDADAAQVSRMIVAALGGSRQYALRTRVRGEYAWEGIYDREIAPLLESTRP